MEFVGHSAPSLHNREGRTVRFLGVTAAGFVAFGFYEIIHARYLPHPTRRLTAGSAEHEVDQCHLRTNSAPAEPVVTAAFMRT